jgi:hypothetical protein
MSQEHRTTNFTNDTDARARAKRQAIADACEHASRVNLDCSGTDAAGPYTLEGCADCETRFKVRPDGTESASVFNPPTQSAYVPSASEYEPTHDGIDAFTSWIETQRDTDSPLFDRRGGRGGVGDYRDNIEHGAIIDNDSASFDPESC